MNDSFNKFMAGDENFETYDIHDNSSSGSTDKKTNFAEQFEESTDGCVPQYIKKFIIEKNKNKISCLDDENSIKKHDSPCGQEVEDLVHFNCRADKKEKCMPTITNL